MASNKVNLQPLQVLDEISASIRFVAVDILPRSLSRDETDLIRF